MSLCPFCCWEQPHGDAPLLPLIRSWFLLPHIINLCSLIKPKVWKLLPSSGFQGLHGVCQKKDFLNSTVGFSKTELLLGMIHCLCLVGQCYKVGMHCIHI
jgi:hypothetical protein